MVTVHRRATQKPEARRFAFQTGPAIRMKIMNRTSPGLSNSSHPNKYSYKKHSLSFSVSKAISGFIQFKGAEGLSPRTLAGYEHDLNLSLKIQGDRDLAQVTTQELREYLNYMRTEYTPCRITGNNDRKLSRKTIRNIWISLSVFFSWLIEFLGLQESLILTP